MTPRYREGDIVRAVSRVGALHAGAEVVVEELVGPDETGTCWTMTVRVEDRERELLLQVAETDVEPTGMAIDPNGERVPLASRPVPLELRDSIELRMFTHIVDGIDAARIAETIEREIVELIGGAAIAIEAERHWSSPYHYELTVLIHPLDDPVEALRRLTEAGGAGWLSCQDDGWRCDLWWSDGIDDEAMLLVPEVRGARLAFLPWRSPRRRPDDERPLVAVNLPDDGPDTV